MTLEQELIDIFASTAVQRNREILIGYYGWEDGRQHTLTEIGARFGITRERVRQVCAKLTKRLKNPSQSPAPVMDRALALIAERLPCFGGADRGGVGRARADGRRHVARKRGGRRTAAGPAGPLSDRQARPTAATTAGWRFGPTRSRPSLAAVDLAKKEVYFHGLTTVERIEQAIAARARSRAGAELVRQTLTLIDGFCWLDEPTGWFRLLPIEQARAAQGDRQGAGGGRRGDGRAAPHGARRNRRLWKEPPPENVLLEFCRQMPRVRIEGDRIISDPPRDWRKSLTGVEAKLVSVLKAHGPVMERGAMEDLCVADGMNRFSFHAFVSWSPVIAQFGHSVYGLLGAEVSPEQVEELLAQRRASRANRRVLDRHGRTDDGKVWLSYRLSKAASTYAVITVPAALKKVVRGRFQFLAADGRAIGTLATKDGRAWGLGAFLRKQAPGSATTSS